jgi:hypothetical protein
LAGQARRALHAGPERYISRATEGSFAYLLLADVIDGGGDFRYRLVGTELRQFFRAEPSAKRMSEALAPFGAETVEATLISYRAVVERRAPMRLTGASVNMILGTFFVWDEKNQFRDPRYSRLAG